MDEVKTSAAGAANTPAAASKAEPIFVTRAFLPKWEEYADVLKGVWESGHLTNNGPVQQAFEKGLAEQAGLAHPLFVVNGTIALHLAIRALDLKGEIITTGFSHPVTTISIIWEGCTPVFVDVDVDTFCIDPNEIERAITPRTTAILATHVYGIPCDVEAIQAIADKHGLKVIYDGAHAFGTAYKGKPVLNYGDISTTSYHATKIFQTVEGGSMHTNDPELFEKLKRMRTMGQWREDFQMLGVNAKNSEFHAAMGVANLPYLDDILAVRAGQWKRYEKGLADAGVALARIPEGTDYNHSYFPAVFRTEEDLIRVRKVLNDQDIHPRRYFFPATTELPYVARAGACPVAEGLAHRVLCLPLYHKLEDASIDRIVDLIRAHT